MKKPEVSIVIPNYNKGCFIEETLQSLLNQDFKDWEAIVVDDHSSDISCDIIRYYQDLDDRIRLIETYGEPKGGSVARNRGAREACSPYLMFLDSDDLLTSGCLSYRISAFKKNESHDFLVFPMGYFQEEVGDMKRESRPKFGQDHLLRILRHEMPWSIMQPLWKRASFESLGGFDEVYPRLQDVELHTRALLDPVINFKIVENAEPDCFYRAGDLRKTFDKASFLQRQVEGGCLYLEKMILLIRSEKNQQKQRVHALKGTYIVTLSRVLHLYMQDEISHKLKSKWVCLLEATAENIKLLNQFDCFLLKMYKKGYEMGFYKMRGYSALGKSVVTRSLPPKIEKLIEMLMLKLRGV